MMSLLHLFLRLVLFLILFHTEVIIQMHKQGKQWSKQEDQMLIQFHQQADCFQRWKLISCLFKRKGIQKTQLQCRDRYLNHINPKLKAGKLSPEEIVKLFECYDENGPKWSSFENKIIGRSQNQLKNQFYSILRSFLRMMIKIGQKKKICSGSLKNTNFKAKFLVNLYENKKKFSKHSSFFKSTLKNIGYCIKRNKIQTYLSKFSNDFLNEFFQDILAQQELQTRKNGQDQQKNSNLSEQISPRVKIQNQIYQREYKQQNQYSCEQQYYGSQIQQKDQQQLNQSQKLYPFSINRNTNCDVLVPICEYDWDSGVYYIVGYTMGTMQKFEGDQPRPSVKVEDMKQRSKHIKPQVDFNQF